MVFSISLNGFFTISIFSVAYEIVVEITYPIEETNSCGVVNSLASFWATLLTIGLGHLLSYKKYVNVAICCGVLGIT